jgi:hypothetical protein
MEMTAMTTTIRLGLSACVAVLALALNAGVANAQQKAPDAPKADAKTAVPPAAKATTPAKKAPSACAGLADAACAANTECMWVKETTTKAGLKRKAHCQKKAVPPAAKKAAAPATPKTTPAPVAPPAKKN